VFDLRYHVASLAAVFLALIIGILVGVGIAGGGFVSKAERKVLNAQIAEAQGQRDAARQRVTELEQEQKATRDYADDTYPALVRDRLVGKRIVLVSIGPMDEDVRSSVLQALADAGAPSALRIRAVKVPVDDAALDAALGDRPAFAQYVGADRLPDLGRALGQELVQGGRTPLWDALSKELVEERSGPDRPPADGVVVMRSAKPQQDGTARFLDGFYRAVAAAGPPAIGVEGSAVKPSAIPPFERTALSTVDSVDTPSGRVALVLLLQGAQPGHYGVRRTATDGILPSIPPASPAGG
jgi:copper transport outer membrane protein MctB